MVRGAISALLAWLVGSLADVSSVQAQMPGAPPAVPAQIVTIFKVEPKEFKSFLLDKKPFASLEVGMDFGTIWPAPGGKHEVALSATGAEEAKLEIFLKPKEVGLLLLDLGPNPDSSKAAQFPKKILLQWVPLALPELDKEARVFAYMPAGGKTVSGLVTHGNEAGVKTDVVPGKLTPLGVGKTALTVDGKGVLFFNPGAPGVYVSVILQNEKGEIRSVPFSFEVIEPETPQPAEKKRQGPPPDY